jgi:hypothetical protein
MRWYCVSGSWRRLNGAVTDAVRRRVSEIMRSGDGIVSGGASGVDAVALDEALRHDSAARRIRIFIPATPERYFHHLLASGSRARYTRPEDAAPLVARLRELRRRNPDALVGNAADRQIDQTAYYGRNTAEIEAADALLAFPVRNELTASRGTWDTIRKAHRRRLPVEIHPFDLTRET